MRASPTRSGRSGSGSGPRRRCLAVNWFGDSLDGTLARVRKHERPRYGFYVDHVLDAIGILFVVGGLFAGGFASILPAAGFLIAYYLLTSRSRWPRTRSARSGSPTGSSGRPSSASCWPRTLQLLNSPWSTIAGHRFLLFDIGLAAGAVGILVTFVVSAVQNTRKLYALEPLPHDVLPAEAGSHRNSLCGFRLQPEGT